MPFRKNNPKSNQAQLFGHLGGILCIAIWGMSFVSTKVLLENGMRPVEIYIYRFVIAYLLILLVARPKQWLCRNWRDEGLMAVCGILGGSAYFMTENFALQYTLVSNVSLLTALSPLITTLLVALFYRNQDSTRGMWVGSVVAFIGAACVIFNSSFDMAVNPLGDMLAITCAISWSLYSLVLKQLNVTYDVWFISRKSFFYGVLTALPFLAIDPPSYSPAEIIACKPLLWNLVFLSIGASLIAYVLWAITIKKVGAIKANNYLYLQPVVTLIGSVIILHEGISVVGVLGCLLILAGLCLSDKLTHQSTSHPK